MRSQVVIALCVVLAGCGISRQAEQQAAEEPTPPSLNDALAECRHAHPDQITQAVARAGCVIKATQLLRANMPFPDLLDRENEMRKMLAEQVQSGKISLIERNRQMTKFHLSMVAGVSHVVIPLLALNLIDRTLPLRHDIGG